MKSSKLQFVFLLLVIFIFQSCQQKLIIVSSSDPVMSLNGSWSFKYYAGKDVEDDSLFYTKEFDISGWESIIVPGHWDIQGFSQPNYPAPKESTGLYRTVFTLPAEWGNNQTIIRFEGVLYAYDVYVNGKYAGSWSSAFNAKDFNITDLVIPGEENILAVKVITRPPTFGYDIYDGWSLSGIFRGVELISLPGIHISDYTVQTFLKGRNKAVVKVSSEITIPENNESEDVSLHAVLYSPEGKNLGKKVLGRNRFRDPVISFKVRNPELWTAETSVIYNLKLMIVKNDSVIQTKNQVVGIREVSIENIVLKLNGQPLKLRGIDHHDTNPEFGKTFTKEAIYKDLSLIKKANINFIRTSHYPPDRRLLEMCDTMGFYILCEVPISSGDVSDSLSLKPMMDRAKATLLRDKNHPSIIIWSIGNENVYTPMTGLVGQYVQKADNTRPICYPQMGHYFAENYKTFPDFLDLYTPHYRSAPWLKEFARETQKPVILTEYAHAQGLSFGHLEDIWAEMFRNERLAGGAVWVFQDQGILRKAENPVNINEPTVYVWVDSIRYYDTNKIEGCDGIVYADRTPQVDYWHIRKVYSPVQIVETELPVSPGEQTLSFQVFNQYDFLDLNTLAGKWAFYKNREAIQEGELVVQCDPHDTVKISLPLVIPENPENDIYRLTFDFSDKYKNPVYEHVIRLNTNKGFAPVLDQVRSDLNTSKLSFNNKQGKTLVQSGDLTYAMDQEKLSFGLTCKESGETLIKRGMYARTGRTVNIVDISVRDRHFAETDDYFWMPFLLEPSVVTDRNEMKSETEYKLSAKGSFERGKKFPGQKVEGEMQYIIKDNGIISLSYNLKPVNASGVFLEAGVSLVLPETFTDVQWIGDGPYSAYPDKYRLNNYGFHYIKKGDINFNGNRRNVEIAVITDGEGNGIAVLGDKSNISIEVKDNRIILSHNALLTGLSNKKTIPLYLVEAGIVQEISGNFEILPLLKNNWPGKLNELFLQPDPGKKPFMPYYYAYDYSR